MFRFPIILCCVFFVSISFPAVADPMDESQSPNQLLEDAGRQITRALELMLKAIPQYEMPEVLDNGDIIIRKVQPKPSGEKPSPEIGETST